MRERIAYRNGRTARDHRQETATPRRQRLKFCVCVAGWVKVAANGPRVEFRRLWRDKPMKKCAPSRHDVSPNRLFPLRQDRRRRFPRTQRNSDKAVSYLMLTNAGGAVAVLSFMGGSDKVRGMAGPRIATASAFTMRLAT